LIMSAGTGGSVSGIAKKPKENISGIKIVAVYPNGSILAKPDSMSDGSTRTGQKRLRAYHVEGISYDFIPTVLDQDVLNIWMRRDDDDSFAMGYNVMRRVGMLIGGSCGATMAGAYHSIREHIIGLGRHIRTLFADSSQNYMSKFVGDDWLTKEGFKAEELVQTTKEKGLFDKLFGYLK